MEYGARRRSRAVFRHSLRAGCMGVCAAGGGAHRTADVVCGQPAEQPACGIHQRILAAAFAVRRGILSAGACAADTRVPAVECGTQTAQNVDRGACTAVAEADVQADFPLGNDTALGWETSATDKALADTLPSVKPGEYERVNGLLEKTIYGGSLSRSVRSICSCSDFGEEM